MRSRISPRLVPVAVMPWLRRPTTAPCRVRRGGDQSGDACRKLLGAAGVVDLGRRDALHPGMHMENRLHPGMALVDHPVLDRVDRDAPRLDSRGDDVTPGLLEAGLVDAARAPLPVAGARHPVSRPDAGPAPPADLEPSEIASSLGSPRMRRVSRRTGRLDELGLLPAPFPIEELLDERDLRHISRLYGIGGLIQNRRSSLRAERFPYERQWLEERVARMREVIRNGLRDRRRGRAAARALGCRARQGSGDGGFRSRGQGGDGCSGRQPRRPAAAASLPTQVARDVRGRVGRAGRRASRRAPRDVSAARPRACERRLVLPACGESGAARLPFAPAGLRRAHTGHTSHRTPPPSSRPDELNGLDPYRLTNEYKAAA